VPDYPNKSPIYTYSYTVRILKRQQLKRKRPFLGNYPKELLTGTTYNTFDGFIECTRIPYIVRKSLMEPGPWGELEVVLKKREEPFRGGIQRPPPNNIRWAYNKPKGY
jgi:hypothetical protein